MPTRMVPDAIEVVLNLQIQWRHTGFYYVADSGQLDSGELLLALQVAQRD